VAAVGDLNADNQPDVIVGAPTFTNGQANEGAVFVYSGSGSGLNTTTPVVLESNQANAQFGQSADGIGDVNADGVNDLVVGAPQFVSDQGNEGAALVYVGSSSGLNTTPIATLQANQANASFGQSVAGLGDLNGDGRPDLSVGAPLFDAGQTDEGAAFVFSFLPEGLIFTDGFEN
jgi:hypothetical protein